MAKRYAIWDKQSSIITPIGEVLNAEQWKARYPVARRDGVVIVCAAGEINGAYFGTLGQMKQIAENQGAKFEEGLTNEQILEVIEAFEDALNDPGDTTESTPEERIAAALEFANVLNMPVDESLPDPDQEV